MPTTTGDQKYRFIDSSTDFEEGWSTFGTRERGVDPMLQEGVGALGVLHGDPQAFHLFSNIDQRQMIEEMEANPAFGKKLTAMLHEPDAVKLVTGSAKRAALNELDGSFPGSRGEWITLRRRLQMLILGIPGAVQSQVEKMTLAQKMAALKIIAQGGKIDLQLGAEAEAKKEPDIWGSLIGGVTGAITSIWTSTVTENAKKEIERLKQQGAAATASGAAQIAQFQAQIEAARLKAGGDGGIPIWTIPVGLGVLGLILYFVLKK